MAGFCTRCGSPLPESGVCPKCAPQTAPPPQAPQYQQPQYQAPQYQAPQYQQPQYQQPQYQAPQYQQPQYQQPQYQQPQYQAPQYQQPQYQQPQYQAPQYQQPAPVPQEPKEPSAFSIAMGNFFKFIGECLKSPAGAMRKTVENKEIMTGIFTIAVTIMAAFLTLLVVDLRYYIRDFNAGPWLLNSFITPVLIYGTGLGGIFLLSLVGKNKVDFKSAVAGAGAAGILPAVFILAALLLALINATFVTNWLYPMFLILCGVSYCVAVIRVFGAKMNLWQILILVGVLFIGYMILDALMGWYFNNVFTFSLRDIYRSLF